MERPAPGEFFSYYFLFSTNASGPIKSFARFLNERSAAAWMDDFAAGGRRILFGLFKTIVLAGSLSPIAAKLGADGKEQLELWFALYAYALHLYFDFSGYTDIAVGLARLFGLRIEENFDWPYLKSNLREFWRSWHMSLTGFMREAVYIPLGGNRVGCARLYFNLTAVFVLIGLWHGLETHYLYWGLYHGAGMVAYRVWSSRREKAAVTPMRRAAGWLFTFHFVVFGWVLFACETSRALDVYRILLTGGSL
ncbi:MAG: hypothetical protein M5R36_22760 [Deltaproteobacteria bacterium]|nr:hypothetical protein [Deltaproteobacteria bacterium]